MLKGIIRTKIIPPPRHARILARPRVTDIITQAFEYRLTLLQAEAGYGKSIALAELAETVKPLAWYQVNEEDSDPLVCSASESTHWRTVWMDAGWQAATRKGT